MIRQITVILLLFFSVDSFSQINFKNQLEVTHWEEYDREIVENWSDLNFQKDFVQIGLRYEVNHPPDPFIFPQDTLLQEFELTYRYAEIYYKGFTATVGNFYSMFGRGLTLRTYEDRNLREDNNIDGLKLNLSGSFYKLQTIAGEMRDKYNRRKDSIYGIDGELNPFRSVQLGACYLYQESPENKTNQIWGSRINFIQDWGDIYAEVAKPNWHDQFSYYLALNITYSKFTTTVEYKDYNHLSFKNYYNTEYNAAPSLTREHAFALLNRHPHALNQNDEKGYQLELTYFPQDEWEMVFNYSKTLTHQGNRIFEEYYGEVHHYFNENLESRIAAAWTYDFTTNTENITPIADVLYNLGERDQLHLNFQHQHTINQFDKSEYDNEFLMIEYSKSPLFTIALVGEYTNKYQLRNIQLDQHYWLYANVTINIRSNHQLSVLYGSRQEGFVCVGGICRYEPEFKGLEVKLINRF